MLGRYWALSAVRRGGPSAAAVRQLQLQASVRPASTNDKGARNGSLVFLHGLLGSSSNWRSFAVGSLNAHHQTVAMDLRNHGSSPHGDSCKPLDMAGDVLETMEAIGGLERPVTVLGHSLGGKVAMQLALAHPAAVDRLIVADIAPVAYGPSDESWATVRPIVDGLAATHLGAVSSRKEAAELIAPFVAPELRPFIMQNLERAGEAFRWRCNAAGLSAGLGDMAGFDAPPGAAFGGPVLFLRGGASPYVQNEHRPAIRQRFPAARIATVEGAGHWLHAEAPEQFTLLVESFLAGEVVGDAV